ncbi:MAG: GAF domain-containing sensor histidine kinase, partial [Rubrobacter sp.]|nr:GAF domain-containing sensor histidine kinase [Rubrobacter sp.]
MVGSSRLDENSEENNSGESGDLGRRNRELSVLNEVARELNRSVDPSEALDFTLSRVAELLGLGTGWVWLIGESSPEPYLAAARNLPPVLANDPRRMDGSGYCYCLDTYKRGDLGGAANVNVVSCSRLKDLVDGTDGLRYHASIPLYASERKLGVMNVASPEWRDLSPDDLRLLYTIGDLLAIAIERSRLFDKSARIGALEERNRLAREIHDTLAQGLTAASLQLESAQALLEAGSADEARTPIERALGLTRSNLEEARRSVLDLRAAPLEGRPLSSALQTLVDRWADETGVSARYRTVNRGHPLPPSVEALLYRVCQESLNNVASHAGASRVEVRLVVGTDQARLSIEDDGRGFDAAEVSDERHGIVGMTERARSLGGVLTVRGEPGSGARVEAR